MIRRLYDDDAGLSKAHNEKVESGEYELIRPLTPDEIDEHESLSAISHSLERAFDRAYRSYINHEENNFLDRTRFYERISGINRREPVFAGMFITRHQGKVFLARYADKPTDEEKEDS